MADSPLTDPVPVPRGSDPAGPSRHRDVFVLLSTILASAMVFIDGNVVNVALPALQATFDADLAGLQWVIESYLLTLTALLLVSGALGDALGRKRVFLMGLGVFTIASIACGLAQTVGQLIAARLLQGVGGALLVPGSLAILTTYFDADRRNQAIGTWSAFSAITVAAAPLLGGWLIDQLSWRAIFYVNVPLALVAAAVGWRWIPESCNVTEACAATPTRHLVARIDWTGAVLATIGLGALVFALVELPRLGLGHPLVFGGGIVGAAALVAFVAHEVRTARPMMPLDLFRHRVFAASNLLTLVLYAALGGVMFTFPLHLMTVRDYTALEAGAALLPFIACLSLLSRPIGGLTDTIGARRLLTAGPAVTACGLLALAWPGLEGGYWTTYFPGVVVLGLGMALAVAPLTATVMNTAPPDRVSLASAINNAVSRLAWLLAVALLGGLASVWFLEALDADAAAVLGAEVGKLGAATPPGGLEPPVHAALQAAIDAAALGAFRAVAVACAALASLAAVIGYLGLPPGPGRRGQAAPSQS